MMNMNLLMLYDGIYSELLLHIKCENFIPDLLF